MHTPALTVYIVTGQLIVIHSIPRLVHKTAAEGLLPGNGPAPPRHAAQTSFRQHFQTRVELKHMLPVAATTRQWLDVV